MTLSYSAFLPDGTELSVDYSVSSWGAPATWDDPAESVEIEVEGAFVDDTDDIWLSLTDDERERIEAEIIEQLERDGPPDDGGDPYDD